jgi:DNA-binding MarR family transcriptional regulator
MKRQETPTIPPLLVKNGKMSTRELIKSYYHSPNKAVKELRILKAQGWIDREQGRHRTLYNVITEKGRVHVFALDVEKLTQSLSQIDVFLNEFSPEEYRKQLQQVDPDAAKNLPDQKFQIDLIEADKQQLRERIQEDLKFYQEALLKLRFGQLITFAGKPIPGQARRILLKPDWGT